MFFLKKSLVFIFLVFLAYGNLFGIDESESPDPGPDPEQFRYLLDYAEDCRTIYFPDDWIYRQYPDAYVKTLPKSNLKFMILRDENPALQRLVFRGTASWNQLFVGFKFFRDDETAEVEMHRGFLAVTREFLSAEIGNLDRNVPITLTGHSMGGAVSILAGMFLHRMGFKIKKIVTFGQPRVTNRKGAELFRKILPITRVQHSTDIVPHLPPTFIGYAHLGELVSMYGPFSFDHFDGKDQNSPLLALDSEDEQVARKLWEKVSRSEIQIEDLPKPSAFPGSDFFRVLGRHGMKFYINSMIANFGIGSGSTEPEITVSESGVEVR